MRTKNKLASVFVFYSINELKRAKWTSIEL